MILKIEVDLTDIFDEKDEDSYSFKSEIEKRIIQKAADQLAYQGINATDIKNKIQIKISEYIATKVEEIGKSLNDPELELSQKIYKNLVAFIQPNIINALALKLKNDPEFNRNLVKELFNK